MNITSPSPVKRTFRFRNSFYSKSSLFLEKFAETRKVQDIASVEELKKNYTLIYELYTSLSGREQQRFQPQLVALHEAIEGYLVIHQRAQILLQDLKSKSLAELREKYDQLYLCLRQLPRGTQQVYYQNLIQIKDRLERGL